MTKPIDLVTQTKVAAPSEELSGELVACTVAAKNYLPHVLVLTESFLRRNPRAKMFLLLADEGEVKSFDDRFIVVKLKELQIKNLESLLFKYNVLEFSTAVKAFFLEYLFDKGFSKLVYLDPDILVTDSFDEISKLLDDHTFALTPHILTGLSNDGKSPGELDISLAGTYNLGFIGIRDSGEARSFLDWWQARVYDYCVLDPPKGMHVDQKWIDLAVGIFPGFHIIRDPGYNVAYWNMGSRRITSKDDNYFINGRPLRFIHFSGLDANNVNQISRHQNRYTLDDLPEYRPIFLQYSQHLKTKGYDNAKFETRAYDYFDNDVRIPYLARWIYRDDKNLQYKYPSPFSTKTEDSFYSWLKSNASLDKKRSRSNVFAAITRRSLDVIERKGFRAFLKEGLEKVVKLDFRITPVSTSPPSSTTLARDVELQAHKQSEFGVNLAGYFTGRFGVAASSRAFAEVLQIGDVPHVLNKVTGENELHKTDYIFDSSNPYPINLIHVNADMTESFFRDAKYVKGKYNIAIWYWELSSFPARFASALRLVDEVWATSGFIADTLSKVSPVPVVKITYPLVMGGRYSTYAKARSQFDFMDDRCVFVSAFNFYSIFERKNPMGLLRAFKKAFSETDNVMLVINHINSHIDENDARLLAKAADGSPIKIIDTMLSPEDYLSLITAGDCYVSLHRSEGLGVPLAEAMFLGKPVIATGYSGNLDFMNLNNSLLVKYGLRELDRNYEPYERGSLWAEPDENHAAQLMRWVYEHREEAKSIGARAREDVKQYLDPKRSAAEIRNRLELVFNKIGSGR